MASTREERDRLDCMVVDVIHSNRKFTIARGEAEDASSREKIDRARLCDGRTATLTRKRLWWRLRPEPLTHAEISGSLRRLVKNGSIVIYDQDKYGMHYASPQEIIIAEGLYNRQEDVRLYEKFGGVPNMLMLFKRHKHEFLVNLEKIHVESSMGQREIAAELRKLASLTRALP